MQSKVILCVLHTSTFQLNMNINKKFKNILNLHIMKKLLMTLAVFCIAGIFSINAQNNSPIHFDRTTHDFGRIKEEGGKVSYTFKFKNNGKQPIIIKNVQSSCGCTTPDWSKTPVLPGKEGFVSAEFDPIDRPSTFTKQISVFNNVTNEPIILEIKGDVIPKTKQVEDLYRYNIGELRLATNHVAFARLLNTEKKSQSIDIINSSDQPITIGIAGSLASHLSVVPSPNMLKPKQTGKLVVEYDASKKGAWGYVIDRVNLTINNKPVNGFPLTVSATILEDFSKLTPSELADAPTMDFSGLEYDFGSIKQGETITHEFTFKNNGKHDLIIRDTQSSCGCTAVETKKVIKPGESSGIKVTFNSAGKSGGQNKSITLITNIPGKDKNGADKYRIVLRIKGEVKPGETQLKNKIK